MIKVLIADDHRMVRAGFRRLLEDEPDIRVVAEAGNGSEALVCLRSQPIDLVLLDMSMPGENGLDVLPKLKEIAPGVCVLVVSMYTDQHMASRALALGAQGYVSKESAAENLVTTIYEACGGAARQ